MKSTRKIKVMQITHDLDLGGLQQVVINLCKFVDKQKFDISILCLRGIGAFGSEAKQIGVKVFALPINQEKTDYFSFLKVARILNKEK